MDIVKFLKERVTLFSPGLDRCMNGENVTVGGIVTSILDIGSLLPLTEDGKEQEGVYICLDDRLGSITVVLSTESFRLLQSITPIKQGSLLLVEGNVHLLNTSHTWLEEDGSEVRVDNVIEKTKYIVCTSIQLCSDDEREIQKF
ncbi:hypothetical protein [Priestia taiwanensis]|uniref:Uncharacterized protein n=1 Tax=Priestia taiwanensis TaxID=1347902 RepID=A0A917EQW7_9BACI|nr:hypothetical protein [Priestia taiwanensis]MBM7363122.1 aspartyl/asparaginyl-tRNA synthetase [Priestia taiwanensis]GGE67864.1 hypothetical protein GCM10007140_17420 [Priestia taiwanensis]